MACSHALRDSFDQLVTRDLFPAIVLYKSRIKLREFFYPETGMRDKLASVGVMKVLIIAESASATFGGEAAIPLHLFRILRQRDVAAWLVTHERNRLELAAILPEEQHYIRYVPDTIWHKWIFKIGCKVPQRISNFTFGLASRLLTQILARRIARQIVRAENITVIHQPIPVSPKEFSLIYKMGVPVIFGPMNGGMTFPPAFRKRDNAITSTFTQIGRRMSGLFHVIFPGKKKAALLLVANGRTREALPTGLHGRIVELVENGVNLDVWHTRPTKKPNDVTQFVFLGRLVDWKAVDLLLQAFEKVIKQVPASLKIVGDGPLKEALLAQAQALHIERFVHFVGWKTQAQSAEILAQSDALVLPSLYECGGAVVLEAMAVGLPVIATQWGGPADYLDEECGILIEPRDPQSFIHNMTEAMIKLAADPTLREKMGKAGRRKIEEQYDWERKVDQILKLYREVMNDVRPAPRPDATFDSVVTAK